MTKEEFIKAIEEIPKEENNKCISTYGSINVEDLIDAVERLNKVPTYDNLLKENKQLKERLNVLEKCNLKTLGDYKSYYADTEKEQILEDTYIDYCAYVNLAHRYSILEKSNEVLQAKVYLLNKQNQENYEKYCNELKKNRKAIDELKRGITFCENDSAGVYDKCNISIRREKGILEILGGDKQ